MPLSKEEKKAKKEAKRLEKLAAEAEKRKVLKVQELDREIKAQKLKRDGIDRSWRELMLKIKEPVFRQEIEIMWHTFERAYDKKDHHIQHIMRLMDVADDQFQRTVASFCNIVDTMINKFLSDLEDLSKENDQRTAELLKRGDEEAAIIMKDHDTAETHLQLLLYHAHHTADTLAWATRGENLVKEDEEKIKYSNERENLRSDLENTYNNIWDEYKAVLKAYVTGTADNQKKVRKLRRKENMMADIIASQGKKIANSDGLLKRLRAELAAYESGTKQAVFRDRRDRHRAACFLMKKHMTDGLELDQKLLNTLVKVSDAAVEWLQAGHEKGEKILRMAALCRKFETQREKVLPYGSALPHSPAQSKTNVRKTNSDELVANAISTTCGLTRMWQRVAKAELTRRALLREKQLLIRENRAISLKLQEMGDNLPSVQASTKTCICSKKDQSKEKVKPVAIEGALEVSKMMMLNS